MKCMVTYVLTIYVIILLRIIHNNKIIMYQMKSCLVTISRFFTIFFVIGFVNGHVSPKHIHIPNANPKCIQISNVASSTANVNFIYKDYSDYPHLRWSLIVKCEDDIIADVVMENQPITAYLTGLEEWNECYVKIEANRMSYINNILFDGMEQYLCESSFVTIPLDLRIDNVHSIETKGKYNNDDVASIETKNECNNDDMKVRITATTQIFEPNCYKYRFEYGPLDTLSFPHKTPYRNLEGYGLSDVVSLPYHTNPSRIRLVIKSKKECNFDETYTSKSITFEI